MSFPWLQNVEREFVERLAGNRIAHALLLTGPADSGKVELGRRFLAAVLCEQSVYPACGQCRSCQLMSTGAHPDGHVLTFEPHPKTGKMRQELVIDQVRRLSSSLCLTNTVSRRKAALLFPAEAMNKSTANALLKTLEEPPGEAVLILVSDAPARLSATIRSRCQGLEVRLPGRKAAVDWLRSQHGVDAERANTALAAAAGSPLRALRLMEDGGLDAYALLNETLDQLVGGAITPPEAMKALEAVDLDMLWGWLSLRAARETRSAVARGMDARDAAGLQREADRNRQWTSTPLRKDLLLQDWLIQWAALNR